MQQRTGIINLTQHDASAEQIEAGVFNPLPGVQQSVKRLLTFEEIPSLEDIERRAAGLAAIAAASGAAAAMIGGAPYLMASLEEALMEWAIEPVYAFSRRESVEVVDPSGSTTKTSMFKHVGFVRGFYTEGRAIPLASAGNV